MKAERRSSLTRYDEEYEAYRTEPRAPSKPCFKRSIREKHIEDDAGGGDLRWPIPLFSSPFPPLSSPSSFLFSIMHSYREREKKKPKKERSCKNGLVKNGLNSQGWTRILELCSGLTQPSDSGRKLVLGRTCEWYELPTGLLGFHSSMALWRL